MPNPADARRSAQVLLHHDKKIDDALWRRLLKECRDPQWPQDRAWTEDAIQKELGVLHREEWRASAGFFYPDPWKTDASRFQNPLQVSHVLRMSPRYQLSSGRMAEVPRFEAEGWHWVSVKANSHDLPQTREPDMLWYLERAKAAVRFFEPDFAAGALDTQLAKGFREDPYAFAWPILVYGPKKVAEVGRDRLLSAPVFLAQELPGGGVWLQVAENPFVAEKAALKPLASYLGLKVAPL